MQTPAKSRLAANVEIDPAALAAAYATAAPEQREEIAEIVEDLFAGLTQFVPMPRFRPGEPTDPVEWEAWRQAVLDRMPWVSADGDIMSQAIAVMQTRGEGATSHRKSSSSSKSAPTKPMAPPSNAQAAPTEHPSPIPLVRVHVSRVLRGVREFYAARPGLARVVAKQLSSLIAAGKVAATPMDRRHTPGRVDMELYGLNEDDQTHFRRRPGALRSALTAFAFMHGGPRIQWRENVTEDEATSCIAQNSVILFSAEGRT